MYKVGDMVLQVDEYSEQRIGVVTNVLKYKDTELFTDTYEGESYADYLDTERYSTTPMTPEEWEDCKNSTQYAVTFYIPEEDTAYSLYQEDWELLSVKEVKRRLLNFERKEATK